MATTRLEVQSTETSNDGSFDFVVPVGWELVPVVYPRMAVLVRREGFAASELRSERHRPNVLIMAVSSTEADERALLEPLERALTDLEVEQTDASVRRTEGGLDCVWSASATYRQGIFELRLLQWLFHGPDGLALTVSGTVPQSAPQSVSAELEQIAAAVAPAPDRDATG